MNPAESAVVAAIDKEMADLQQDMIANPDPRIARFVHLQEVRALYLAPPPTRTAVEQAAVGLPPSDAAPPSTPTIHKNPWELGPFEIMTGVPIPPRRSGRQTSPERLKALATIREFLSDKNSPMKTSTIYDYLRSRGIQIGGADPVNNLSAMLSSTDGFRTHGRSGWTLESQEVAA